MSKSTTAPNDDAQAVAKKLAAAEAELTIARDRISQLEARLLDLRDELDELEGKLADPDPEWLAAELAEAVLRNPPAFVERLMPRIVKALAESRRLAAHGA